jgi:multidrug efflux pump subunit AcrA (membrane-fusion protein)
MRRILIISVVTLLTLVGCQSEVVEQVESDAVPVRVATTRVDFVEETYVTIGEIVPENSIELTLPAGAQVGEVYVVSGEYVDVGQKLLSYTLDGNAQMLLSTQQGLVSKIYTGTGMMSMGPVIRLVDDTEKLVKTMLSSELQKKLSIGDAVEIVFNDGQLAEGEIIQLSPEAEAFSRLYETHIRLPESEVSYGEFVELRFITDRHEAILVPAKAIVRKSGEKYIYQYVDGELKKVMVETGLSKGDWIELANFEPMNFDFIISGQNFIADEDRFVVVD